MASRIPGCCVSNSFWPSAVALYAAICFGDIPASALGVAAAPADVGAGAPAEFDTGPSVSGGSAPGGTTAGRGGSGVPGGTKGGASAGRGGMFDPGGINAGASTSAASGFGAQRGGGAASGLAGVPSP